MEARDREEEEPVCESKKETRESGREKKQKKKRWRSRKETVRE